MEQHEWVSAQDVVQDYQGCGGGWSSSCVNAVQVNAVAVVMSIVGVGGGVAGGKEKEEQMWESAHPPVEEREGDGCGLKERD